MLVEAKGEERSMEETEEAKQLEREERVKAWLEVT